MKFIVIWDKVKIYNETFIFVFRTKRQSARYINSKLFDCHRANREWSVSIESTTLKIYCYKRLPFAYTEKQETVLIYILQHVEVETALHPSTPKTM